MIANPEWLTDGIDGTVADAVDPLPEDLDVLLVEDNPGDVDLVRLYLAQEPRARVELHCVESLSTARAHLGTAAPDVVLLDLGLPDGSGLEVIRTVRRLAADVPIVVLTGQSDPGAGLEALQCDAQDYLVKSQLNAAVLFRSIRYAVERHRWQQQYRQQLASSPDGIVVLDEEGTVRFANGAAAVLLGGAPRSLDELPRVLTTGSGPTDVTLPTGRIVEARTADTVWQGVTARLITLRDMTERREAERTLGRLTHELRVTNQRLEELVGTDPLTGVYNRRGLEEVLGREVDRLHRTGDGMVAVLVDCDDFKGINDGFGHAVGDAALKALIGQVRDALRAGDHVGRVGGDEFLVLLPETTIREGLAVAEKLRHAIKATRVPVADGSIALSASLAAGAVEPDVVAIEQILTALGPALKRSKGAGKDRVSADGVIDAASAPSGSLLDPAKVHLGVALQTIRRLDTEAAVGFEALTRGPPGDLRLPSELFQAAFEQDVLTTLDLRALASSLALLREVGGEGWYHVNLFPSTVLNTPVDRLARLFAGARGSARVCVELSEQQFLGDPTYLREPLQALRESGVRVAIDDVGFGRSSIEALLLLEPDVVKVDRRCVQRIATHEGERRRLQRLMDMLLAVGADVIIEGVETPAERDVLKEMGVAYAQGFLWDEPSTASRTAST